MDKTVLKALELALSASPNNKILREQVAHALYSLEEFSKAKEHYSILLGLAPQNLDFKFYLARCYYKLKNYTTGIFICEEILKETYMKEVAKLFIWLLIDDNQIEQAVLQYQTILDEEPSMYDEEIEKKLKIPSGIDSSEFDDDEGFLQKPNLDFSKVGGMDQVKEEIKMKIIMPIQKPELFKAFGKKAGGGILMYGPPGCGKTYLSKATAGEISSKFLSVGIDEVLDMWLGNSEKNLHYKFELARKNTPCVMFFDEIDALGSKRNDLKQSAGRNIINQFLKELDGVDSNNEGVLILGATNSPWHMDSAFLRPGRFDRIIFVPPPDEPARADILKFLLEDKPAENIDFEKIASKTDHFSGADLKLLVDLVVEEKLRKSMSSGKIELISTKDILNVTGKVRPSTREWFNTARNYAMYSNTSGIYDDIKKYLNL